MKKLSILLAILILALSSCKQKQKSDELIYKNPKYSTKERVEDLLKRMTLEEKIGQMSQLSTHTINSSKKGDPKSKRFRPYLDSLKADSLIRNYHIGSFLAGFAVPPQDWYIFIRDLQKISMKAHRLGIPIIYGNDNIHGANYVTGGTVFPQALGLACTFNDKLAAEMGKITAIETADIGQHWNFAPVLGIGRNPYWPRIYETMGESHVLISRMGKEYIQALQNCEECKPYKVAACAKHFIGYSDPKSGYDRSPAVLSEQELREYFLPPFKAAIDAGVKTFMINSGEVNGDPVHASSKFINGWLRKELGFNGVIVTDWADIFQLVGQHRMAKDEKEATKMAILAGIDMSMIAGTTSFCTTLKELVEEGEVPIEVIDNAVRRILTLKFDLGLFENPYPRNDRFDRIGSVENKKAALEAARESIVLLKNENNILPLKNPSSILVGGPSANSKRNICGGWTIEWGGAPEEIFPKDQLTLYDAIKKQFSKTNVNLSENINKPAEIIIVAVGEEPHAEGRGNTNDLTLPAEQIELIKKAASKGKKVILVMFSGRPRVISEIINDVDAFIWAGLPGYEGGKAVAEIISGEVNPSGKLAFSYPKGPGGITPHNCKRHDIYNPLYEFGYGLSYTNFEYSDITISDSLIGKNDSIIVSVKVKNTGNIEGKEAILCFLRDDIRTITPSKKELVDYTKIDLKPGEEKNVKFVLSYKQFAFPNRLGKVWLEEGEHTIFIADKKINVFVSFDGKAKRDEKASTDHLQQNVGIDN